MRRKKCNEYDERGGEKLARYKFFIKGNSMKKHENQKKVCLDICKQLEDGNKNIVGAMIESHLKSGNQKISEDMEYGRSITDACIDFEETKNLLTALSDAVKERRKIE